MNYQMIRRSTDGLRHLKHSHQLRAMMKRRDRLEKLASFSRTTSTREVYRKLIDGKHLTGEEVTR